MTWVLIRHGMTRGNMEKRYVGIRTDEALCPEGKAQLKQRLYPLVQSVYSSPMRRCVETAGIIYPGLPIRVIPDFRECDFGSFEYRNYEELNGREDYQAWIDSGGELPFPGGESRSEFCARTLAAFHALSCRAQEESCALVVHGGTIMAIMESVAFPKGSYYDFQVGNGSGYLLFPDGSYRRLEQ